MTAERKPLTDDPGGETAMIDYSYSRYGDVWRQSSGNSGGPFGGSTP